MQMEDGTPEEDQDPIGLEIKSDIQLVLSALCETDLHRKVGPQAPSSRGPPVSWDQPLPSLLTWPQ